MKALRHPLQGLSRGKRLALFGGALVLTFVMFSALGSLDVPLQKPSSRWGMLSFEFSGTAERSREILASWDNAARDSAKSSLLLDFLFPPCYATTLTLACFWAAGLFRDRGYRKTATLATVAAWVQCPAAVLDYVENVALWIQLRGSVSDPWPGVARWCATLKFALIVYGLTIIIWAVTVWVLRRRVAPQFVRVPEA